MAGCRKKPKVVYRAGIRCFAELNVTRKSHYCFGDFQSLKSGERTKKSKAVYGALIRCFAELNVTRKSHYCFGDFQSLKSGERTKKSKVVYGALIRCFAVLSMTKTKFLTLLESSQFRREKFFGAQI
jgi:hypothetical protein